MRGHRLSSAAVTFVSADTLLLFARPG
jgi:hypothetical protein